MGKPTILVVEDNPKNIRRVESILGEDYNLRITNLDDAVKILNGEKGIDLILANILQKDHGREDDRDTALIKKAKSTKSKLVVISDAEEGFSHVEALIRGVDGYASLFGYRSKRGLASIVESALNAEEQERQLEMKLSPGGNLESILVINQNPVVAEELQKHYEGKYEILHADDAKLARRMMNRRNIHAAIIDTSLLDEKKIADIEKRLRIRSEQRNEKCQILTYGPTPKNKSLLKSYLAGLITHVLRYKRGGLTERLVGLIKSQIEPHTKIRKLESRVEIFEKISHNYVLKQAYEILEEIESEVGQRHLSKGIDAEFVETFSDQLLEARHIIEHVFEEKEKLTGKIKIILRDDFEDGAETFTLPQKYVRQKDNQDYYLLKRYRSLKSAVTAYRDYHHFRDLREKEDADVDFRIARVWTPVVSTKGEALTLGRMKISPNLTRVFEVLNPEIEKGDKKSREVKLRDAILSLNLERLHTWQEHAPYLGEKEKDAEAVLDYYKDNLNTAFTRADIFTTLDLSPAEQQLIKHALTIFDDELIIDEETVTRNLDNSPGNSGLELRVMREGEVCSRMEASKDDLLESFFEEKGPDSEYLREACYHWDTGDKMGHFLEDFWHMISSFEAQLERPDQKKWFELFMEIKYGERAKKKMKEHAVDSNLVAVYRNLRKRDLVAIKYALKDEYLANEGHEEISNAISERREQHQEKFIYYTEQSQYHLDNMLTELRARYKDRLDNPVKIQLEERELSAYNYLKQLSSEVNKKGLDESNAKLFLEYFEKLDKMASEMEDPDMVKTVSAISRVGKVIVLKHAVMKSHSYPEIKFESLLDEKNRDYLETQLERIR